LVRGSSLRGQHKQLLKINSLGRFVLTVTKW